MSFVESAIEGALYVAARRVLLDACDALGRHRDAMILVGAQAIYLHAGDVGLDVVSPFTSDTDLSIDPSRLGSSPAIAAAMSQAGFTLKVKAGGNGVEPGAWQIAVNVAGRMTPIEVDLMVPESVAPGRGRDAKLPDHGRNATRIGPGLEASVVDCDLMGIASLEPDHDTRTTHLRVAGIVGARLAELGLHPMCGASVTKGVEYLRRLFGTERAPGVDLDVDNLATAVPEDELRIVIPAYLKELLDIYGGSTPDRSVRRGAGR